MRRSLSLILSFALALSIATPTSVSEASVSWSEYITNATIDSVADTTETDDYVEGEVLVTYKDSSEDIISDDVADDMDMEVEETWTFGKSLCISEVSSDTSSTEEMIEELEDEDDILYVEPNYYRYKTSTTTDTYRTQQWYLDGGGAYTGTSTGVNYDSTSSLTKSDTPVVAVVDTGIDYTHEDLADHMWVNTYSSLSGTYGYDFGDYDSDPMDEDEDGHGTHCAGVISAVSDNATGITGISDAKLMALKIFDSEGSATEASIIAAFNYIYKAQTLGVNITAINCSWGGNTSSSSAVTTLVNKIGKKGAVFVFSAGNDSIDHDSYAQSATPYDLSSDYVIIVGATDVNDNKAAYSDYGKSSVDLFAPGTSIFSTVNEDTFYPSVYNEEIRDSLCSYYNPYDTYDDMLYTASDLGINTRNSLSVSTSYSSEDAYYSSDSGSFHVSISASHGRSTLGLYVDVTDLGLDPDQTYYISYELGMTEGDDVVWDHYTTSATSSRFVTKDDKTYLLAASLSGDFSSISDIYIDDMAVSTANPDTSSFGKYNTLTGTSMAAPVVTGAVALLSSVYTDDTAKERRSRLLTCVRTVSGLSSYCSTGGILDLSKVATSTVTVTDDDSSASSGKVLAKKVKLNKKKATLRYKKKLKLKATVKPTNATNKKVRWYVNKKKYAKVTKKGVVKAKKKGIGHTVRVYAKAKDGSGKKAYCKVKIKKRRKKK